MRPFHFQNYCRSGRTDLTFSKPRSQSFSAISDVTSPVEPVGKGRQLRSVPSLLWQLKSDQGTKFGALKSPCSVFFMPIFFWFNGKTWHDLSVSNVLNNRLSRIIVLTPFLRKKKHLQWVLLFPYWLVFHFRNILPIADIPLFKAQFSLEALFSRRCICVLPDKRPKPYHLLPLWAHRVMTHLGQIGKYPSFT